MWCVDDALAMRQMLAFHENHDPNFDCHVLLGSEAASEISDSSSGSERVTFNMLRVELQKLFAFDDMVLFYFSGHGYATANGVYIVTQDGTGTLPGILLNDILGMANDSPAREVVLIIDSCYSGSLGEPHQNQDVANLYLRPGVTLLAAASTNEVASERNGHGQFTQLVIGALKGGAKDVRGRVSAASIYAHVEQALGPWDQRPIYKSNATQLSPVRFCTPSIMDGELRRLPQFFTQADSHYFLDPSYEVTRPEALFEHIAVFKIFKHYQVAGLLHPIFDEDLYFAALRSHPVELTPMGQFYWQLAKQNLLGGSPSMHVPRRLPVPDAESVARLFHEAYERLAPAFGYETREATRVPWESVPERNKHLMIAVTAEVLAMLFPLEEATPPIDKTVSAKEVTTEE
jgi:hypothetical protein